MFGERQNKQKCCHAFPYVVAVLGKHSGSCNAFCNFSPEFSFKEHIDSMEGGDRKSGPIKVMKRGGLSLDEKDVSRYNNSVWQKNMSYLWRVLTVLVSSIYLQSLSKTIYDTAQVSAEKTVCLKTQACEILKGPHTISLSYVIC